MKNWLLDIKVLAVSAGYALITSFEADMFLKVVCSIFVIAFTARRWYLMEKKYNNENK